MSWSDIANAAEAVAPTIATAVLGPLGGMGVSAIEKVFGITPQSSTSLDERTTAAAAAIAGATPDQLIALKKADQDFQVQMKELGFKDTETLASLAVQDRSSARTMEVSTRSIMPPLFGMAIILGSLGAAAAILAGKVAYANTTEATMVGTVIGYLFSEAKAVLAFYFGSTHDTEQVNDLLAKSTPPGNPQ